MKRNIKVLDEISHILLRPNMYVGSVKSIKEERFLRVKDTFQKINVSYVPALVKIFEEILDNSVDAFVDNNFKGKPKISITVDETSFSIEDNGTGIPNEKILNEKGEGKYQCEVAWGSTRAGSNFDDTKRKSGGANGVGSYLTNIFSNEFIAENKNGGKKVICHWTNNAGDYKMKESVIKDSGVKVQVEPDFSRFHRGTRACEKFNADELKIITTRLNLLSITYPEIKFVLNGDVIDGSKVQF